MCGGRWGFRKRSSVYEHPAKQVKSVEGAEMMRRRRIESMEVCIFSFIFSMLALSGCAGKDEPLPESPPANIQASEEPAELKDISGEEAVQTEEPAADDSRKESNEPAIEEMDWSDYFDGINGAAVLYDPMEKRYQIYNQETALTRRSPCSTFKIISSLTALECGIIVPDDSVRTWSGETFWNEEWNRDIDFSDAFHASCVWYFREVIDEIGMDRMQQELNRLSYGNCDISDWEGHLNTNNSNPALTGFWLESSLQISPKEQAEVMERIFGEYTDYSEETRKQLEQVMRLSDSGETDFMIYGKTGMGKAVGIVVDAWFTGFADHADRRIYFCVYMGETNNQEVSSARARETAVKILSDFGWDESDG